MSSFVEPPSFVESHLSHYHLNPDNHLLMLHPSFHTKILISPINFSGDPHISIFPIPASRTQIDASESLNFPDSMETLVGSINGLVSSFRPPLRPTNVIIWTPTTRRSKNILVPRIDIKYVCRILVGFGFSFVVNDDKIVCIYELGLGLQTEPCLRFGVPSSKF